MGKIQRMTEAEKAKIAGIIELYTCIQSEGINIVTGKQIGRASCRERVSSPV